MTFPTYHPAYRGPRYTAAQFRAGARLYARGETYADAAVAVGMSPATLYRFLRRNGLVEGRPSGFMAQMDLAGMRRETVEALTRRGYSAREIAERLDVSPRTVMRHRASIARSNSQVPA